MRRAGSRLSTRSRRRAQTPHSWRGPSTDPTRRTRSFPAESRASSTSSSRVPKPASFANPGRRSPREESVAAITHDGLSRFRLGTRTRAASVRYTYSVPRQFESIPRDKMVSRGKDKDAPEILDGILSAPLVPGALCRAIAKHARRHPHDRATASSVSDDARVHGLQHPRGPPDVTWSDDDHLEAMAATLLGHSL